MLIKSRHIDVEKDNCKVFKPLHPKHFTVWNITPEEYKKYFVDKQY
jgi:hypothetical protein